MPSVIRPSTNSSSVPLMRGDPSARSVARVLLVPARKAVSHPFCEVRSVGDDV